MPKLAHKLQDEVAYAPRGMRAPRAAAYLDISLTKFLQLVAEKKLPAPYRKEGIVSWDRLELDAAWFNGDKGGVEGAKQNSVDVALGLAG